MSYKKLINIYRDKQASDLEILQVTQWIDDWKAFLLVRKEEENLETLSAYVQDLIRHESNPMDHLIALARYYYTTNQRDLYIYFTSIFGSVGVIDQIKTRMIDQLGIQRTHAIFNDLLVPALGSPGPKMCLFTEKFITKLKEDLSFEELKGVLAGNNHNIPLESMLGEKAIYEQFDDLDAYLKDRHTRKIQELKNHMTEGKVWFEQVINQEVIDYVSSNQEILSGVRKGNKLYITKIPYDTKKYLEAESDIDKRYFACHCPFARDSIFGKHPVDQDWCYCSAGFAKFPFEVLFGRDLEVKLLKTPLAGDLICRFEITLPDDMI